MNEMSFCIVLTLWMEIASSTPIEDFNAALQAFLAILLIAKYFRDERLLWKYCV